MYKKEWIAFQFAFFQFLFSNLKHAKIIFLCIVVIVLLIIHIVHSVRKSFSLIFINILNYVERNILFNEDHWKDSISNIKFKSKSWCLGIYSQKGKDIYIFCVRMFFLMWQYRCKRHYNKAKYVSTVYAKNREIKLKFRDLNIILRYLSRFSSDM